MRLAFVVLCACGRLSFDDVAASTSGSDGGTDIDAVDRCAQPFALPPASSFEDDFTAPLADRWRVIDGAPGCVAEGSGELVASPPDTPPNYCFVASLQHYHLTCSSVSVEVPEVTRATLGVQTLIYVNTPTDHIYLLLEGGGFLVDVPGAFQLDTAPGYDPVRDRWWRLREDHGVLYFETAPDGTAWSVRGHGPVTLSLEDVWIALGAGTHQDTAMPGVGRFRCLNKPAPCM